LAVWDNHGIITAYQAVKLMKDVEFDDIAALGVVGE
jgi:hypothetical protein